MVAISLNSRKDWIGLDWIGLDWIGLAILLSVGIGLWIAILF
jgi:hypothetical protein